ncbi:MAG: hypothetical protein ABIG93_03605 [archaeon]|nr:hypothetical protein [Nanoarchaeota archaeon]
MNSRDWGHFCFGAAATLGLGIAAFSYVSFRDNLNVDKDYYKKGELEIVVSDVDNDGERETNLIVIDEYIRVPLTHDNVRRNFPEKANERQIERTYMLKESGTLDDGTRLGKLGARKFVINNVNLPISPGFHEFIELDNGAYIGKLGAMRYLLDKDWSPTSAGYHEIIPNSTGYDSILGQCHYTLSLKGEIRTASSEKCKQLPESY